MSDELLLPQVPEPKPEDPEDVSWALSTAEAMWARGDHSEGVKWVRRAAEAASDAEQDERSLELAKAAADLAGLVTRRASRASIHIDDDELVADEPAPPPKPPQAQPKPAPPKPAPKAPASVTKQVSTPSRPPAPLPSKTSQPPPALGARPAKPFGTNTKSVPPPKMASAAPKSDPKRRSRPNLDAEARRQGFDQTMMDLPKEADTAESPVIEQPVMRRSRPEIGSNDPTFVGNVADLMKKKAGAASGASDDDENDDRTAEEWDASPTQNLTGDEMGFPNFPIPNMPPGGDPRKTQAALPNAEFKSALAQIQRPGGPNKAPPASSSASSARQVEPHDPGIVTTQAVRVVVWRDANGVHVAPAGTVVSAITVDAVLVALDSNADLTAWLTQKGR